MNDNLVRLAVGIEEVEDLISDLTQALDVTAVAAARAKRALRYHF